jgi:ubiquinone/menaquinone biosynthesis C-methylase UbiE
VVGIDPDPKALARARRKPTNAAVSIQFDQVFRDDLPYAEASFDRVFSSFMFHHLPPDEKVKTLGAVRSSSRVVGFTCSTSEGQRMACTVFSPTYFTQASA